MRAGCWHRKNGQTFHTFGVDARAALVHTPLMTMTTAAKATETTTADLWFSAHHALCDGRWSVAVGLLEALGERADNSTIMSPASSYGLAGHWIEQVIQDRIDWVNSRVGW